MTVPVEEYEAVQARLHYVLGVMAEHGLCPEGYFCFPDGYVEDILIERPYDITITFKGVNLPTELCQKEPIGWYNGLQDHLIMGAWSGIEKHSPNGYEGHEVKIAQSLPGKAIPV